ncbi:MAG: transketolase [Anaerolineaceae bacterium]
MEIQTLERKSIEYRRSILRIIKLAKAGHTGGSLSCVDILNVLYNQVLNVSPQNFNDPDRDRYIQSKGHSVEALYVVLAERGFISNEQLETIEQYQSDLIGHPSRKVPGIEHNTGALGHGLSVAVGMALAAKKDKRAYRVFALLGDGELTEGSGWEAAMSASHYGLDNLTAIVDRNGLQITGKTEMVMRLEPLVDKYTAFGFAVREVDGNNLAALSEIFKQLPFVPGKPSLVLAHTVKGKGISFIENQVNWHHRVPTDEEYATAMKELDQAEKEWQIRYANTING